MKIIVIVLAFLTLAATQSPPVWPARFQQDFVESYTSTQFRDVGKIWYEPDRARQRVDRTNGKYDPFCGAIQSVATPCTHLITNSKRWLYFPLLRQCCVCCDQAHGCGVLRQDWLRNAKFAGKEDLSGQSFNKFVDVEGKIEYWATTDSKQISRRLIQNGNTTKDFIMNTFTEEYIADNIFAVPSYCNQSNLCTGFCTQFRSSP